MMGFASVYPSYELLRMRFVTDVILSSLLQAIDGRGALIP
jgi:hypothetical protein